MALEYNVRLGDPETQAILPRLSEDFFEVLHHPESTGGKSSVCWDDQAAVSVVMASRGYPDRYEKGAEILGLDGASKLPNTKIFHAGTKLEDGRFTTAGGRVLNVTSWAPNVEQARAMAYEGVRQINCPGLFYRNDIGKKSWS